MSVSRALRFALSGLALAAVAASAQPVAAQKEQSGGAMQGFQMNRDQPVKVEADSLEVRDKSRQATFSGSVKLTQGETILQCRTLVIFYDDAPAPGGKKNAPQAAQKASGPTSQQIKRAEAKGDVLVTQKDQTARGDNGIFDVKSNTVTLTGNVVVTQGTNVLRGERMLVNLTTGVATVESGQSKTGTHQRVEGLFNPSAAPAPAASPPPQKDAKDAKPAPAAKPGHGAPIRIN